MKTPYCGVLEVQRREVDRLKVSIGEQIGRLSEIDELAGEVAVRVHHERALVSDDWQLSSAAYFLRVRKELEDLRTERTRVDAQLDHLREKAREALGSLQAVESAADAYRSECVRQEQVAEQLALDDRNAAELLKKTRARRFANSSRAA